MDEEVHFGIEAEGVSKDVEQCVNKISVSTILPASRERAYINLVTKENQTHCIELSRQGFRVRFLQVLFDNNLDLLLS